MIKIKKLIGWLKRDNNGLFIIIIIILLTIGIVNELWK